MNRKGIYVLAGLLLAFTAQQAAALAIGKNITISDGNYSTSSAGNPKWWQNQNEDNEGEPGVYTVNNTWDLEGVFLDNSLNMTMVAGYNFMDPYSYNSFDGMGHYRRPGDVFIDTTGDHGLGGWQNSHGFEYCLDMDWTTGTFDLYRLDNNSWFWGTAVIDSSKPWKRTQGGTLLAQGLSFGLTGVQTGANLGGVLGDGYNPNQHWGLQIDLSSQAFVNIGIPARQWWVQWTMNCGNDVLVGHYEPPKVSDTGTTMLMMAAALSVVGIVKRRIGA